MVLTMKGLKEYASFVYYIMVSPYLLNQVQ